MRLIFLGDDGRACPDACVYRDVRGGNARVFIVNIVVYVGTNNVITSMAPLYYKGKASAGLLAGVLNGCCYIGSTLSSYGLGAVADGYGWNAVFYLLIACSSACVIISAIKTVIRKPKI